MEHTMAITEDQIADMALKACFYVTPEDQWLRIDYCDMSEGYFQCHDEESFEEYRVDFAEVTLQGNECFYQLNKMEVVDTESV
jgi:hypothetical protein